MITTKNYAGIADEFAQLETAKVVLIPVPYDGTSTWGKGADKGPEAFLAASVTSVVVCSKVESFDLFNMIILTISNNVKLAAMPMIALNDTLSTIAVYRRARFSIFRRNSADGIALLL